jgi:hypothetical protein
VFHKNSLCALLFLENSSCPSIFHEKQQVLPNFNMASVEETYKYGGVGNEE